MAELGLAVLEEANEYACVNELLAIVAQLPHSVYLKAIQKAKVRKPQLYHSLLHRIMGVNQSV